jgi:hypothetical protein
MQDGRFLPFYEALSVCQMIGIDFIRPIFTGSKDESYEWVQRNVTTMKTGYQKPGAEGTPYHEPVAEGLVMRNLGQQHF